MLPLAPIVATVAAANVLVGWHLGFRAASAYLLFWALAGLVVATAIRLVRAVFPWRGAIDAALRVAVVAFAVAVASAGLLGVAGLVAPLPLLVVAVGGFLIARLLPAPPQQPTIDARHVPAFAAAVLCPIVAFVLAAGLRDSPLTLYDSLSYHLFFPARWLQEHRLFLIATPFSDEAQAYAPGNGELFFLWLMTPFHGDLAARIGQFPFYLTIATALYALCRRLRVAPAHAVWVPALYLFARPIVEQAAGADVDLVCWAMFLASIYLGFVALDRDDGRDWALWGVAAGLYLGTKYVAIVYAPIVFAVPLLRGFRRATLWTIPALLAFGAPWYVRNWVVAGSPIYPSSVAAAGVTIAQGAFTRAAMNHSVFHTIDIRLLPIMIAHAFGTPLALVWLPLAAAGIWRMRSASPRREALFLLSAPIAMTLLYWIGVPDNVDSRFLLPAAMLALVPIAFLFHERRTAQRAMHFVLAAAVAWIAIGYHAELPVPLPWYMGGWLALDGIVARQALAPFLAIAAAGGTAAWVAARRPRLVLPLATALVAVGATALATNTLPTCGPSSTCELLSLSSIFIRPTMVDGWQWTAANVRNATIAYTGNNVPYPLAGDHLTNRVRYVNIDRHRDWLFHDYDRAHRRRRDDAPPVSPLAAPSGVLLPLPGPPRWHVDAVRPRYERQEGDRSAWIANLKSLGVDRLFISALSAYEIDFVAHDAAGFPVENAWARDAPSTFTLLYDNQQIRIYAVHPP